MVDEAADEDEDEDEAEEAEDGDADARNRRGCTASTTMKMCCSVSTPSTNLSMAGWRSDLRRLSALRAASRRSSLCVYFDLSNAKMVTSAPLSWCARMIDCAR